MAQVLPPSYSHLPPVQVSAPSYATVARPTQASVPSYATVALPAQAPAVKSYLPPASAAARSYLPPATASVPSYLPPVQATSASYLPPVQMQVTEIKELAPVMRTIVREAPASYVPEQTATYLQPSASLEMAAAVSRLLKPQAKEPRHDEDPCITVLPYFQVRELDPFLEVCGQAVELMKGELDCTQFGFTIGGDVAFCRSAFKGTDGVLSHFHVLDGLYRDGFCKYGDLLSLQIHGPKAELEILQADPGIQEMNAEFYELLPGSWELDAGASQWELGAAATQAPYVLPGQGQRVRHAWAGC